MPTCKQPLSTAPPEDKMKKKKLFGEQAKSEKLIREKSFNFVKFPRRVVKRFLFNSWLNFGNFVSEQARCDIFFFA
jgi:hypothetical protein